jgi:hypothetical protein
MENFDLLLPSIPEDYEKSIEVDGTWFPDIKKYKSLMEIFYISSTPKNLKNISISRVEKKELLLKILLMQDDVLKESFLQRLKNFIPEGLCYENICTDSEYENLKKEFGL